MLALVGTHYHFRRVVPVALRPLFGKTEFWISLKTGNKSEARLSAMTLHAQTSALFRTARLMTTQPRRNPSPKTTFWPCMKTSSKSRKRSLKPMSSRDCTRLKLECYTTSMAPLQVPFYYLLYSFLTSYSKSKQENTSCAFLLYGSSLSDERLPKSS